MKKAHESQYENGIFKHYALFFWRYCCMCHTDFKREHGFRFLTSSIHNRAGQWKYICSDCAPTKKVANTIATLRLYIPTKPTPPPPPPPKE